MLYMLVFIKLSLGLQKLGEAGAHIHTQQGDLISPLLLFSQNKENVLIIR
jgi:hypothetical protein